MIHEDCIRASCRHVSGVHSQVRTLIARRGIEMLGIVQAEPPEAAISQVAK